MILYIVGYVDLKNAVIFLILNFSQYFGKIKIYEIVSIYFNHECLQLKITKFAMKGSGNSTENF